MSTIFTLTKKELKSYFDTPIAYIVMVVFLLLWQFLFFKNIFFLGEASLRPLFALLPWLFLLLIPALTMGAISQEKHDGTLEFLLTHPVKEWQLILGKFLGSAFFVLGTLLFVFPVAWGIGQFGDLDWGVVWGQFLASVNMGMLLVALGICVSSFFSRQVSALLVTLVISFFLIIMNSGFITGSLPQRVGVLLERLSVSSHFESMSRGVLDWRDIFYFFSLSAIFLSLAYLQLIKRKYGKNFITYTAWRLGIALFIGIVVLLNSIGSSLHGRLDLTEDNLYTLSPATQRVVQNLDDVVNITLYASQELPAQMQPVFRDITDILRDYTVLSGGNIRVQIKDPSHDSEIAQEATSRGIQEVQFNVVRNEELQVKKGYLGLSMSYGGEHEGVPFIQSTGDLEYTLTSFLLKLTATEKKKVLFLAGHGEKTLAQDYTLLTSELSGQFTIEEFSFPVPEEGEILAADAVSVPEDTDLLVIAGPTQAIEPHEQAALRMFLDHGGAVLFLLDPITINMSGLIASENLNSFTGFVADYGITVESNIVYDLKSKETVSFGGGFITYMLPYPFWARSLAQDTTAPIAAQVGSLVLPWAASLKLSEAVLEQQHLSVSKLFVTTESAGVQSENFILDPQQRLSQKNLAERIMAVSVMSTDEHESKKRFVVVGDSDFLTDNMLQASPENMAFGMSAISWLAQEESLAAIRLKDRAAKPLLFEDQQQKTILKYGNMALSFFLPLFFGLWRFLRRRSLRKHKFSVAALS